MGNYAEVLMNELDLGSVRVTLILWMKGPHSLVTFLRLSDGKQFTVRQDEVANAIAMIHNFDFLWEKHKGKYGVSDTEKMW